eukprot:7230652-Pyramimonas_sp.AAC.1
MLGAVHEDEAGAGVRGLHAAARAAVGLAGGDPGCLHRGLAHRKRALPGVVRLHTRQLARAGGAPAAADDRRGTTRPSHNNNYSLVEDSVVPRINK